MDFFPSGKMRSGNSPKDLFIGGFGNNLNPYAIPEMRFSRVGARPFGSDMGISSPPFGQQHSGFVFPESFGRRTNDQILSDTAFPPHIPSFRIPIKIVNEDGEERVVNKEKSPPSILKNGKSAPTALGPVATKAPRPKSPIPPFQENTRKVDEIQASTPENLSPKSTTSSEEEKIRRKLHEKIQPFQARLTVEIEKLNQINSEGSNIQELKAKQKITCMIGEKLTRLLEEMDALDCSDDQSMRQSRKVVVKSINFVLEKTDIVDAELLKKIKS